MIKNMAWVFLNGKTNYGKIKSIFFKFKYIKRPDGRKYIGGWENGK